VRGEWVPVERLVPDWGANITHHYECSNCKILEYTNDRKYCSNCGAKMEKKR
jgi:ribosomal protein L37E